MRLPPMNLLFSRVIINNGAVTFIDIVIEKFDINPILFATENAVPLSVDDVIDLVEKHPEKDEILGKLMKRYLSLSLNGKV